MMNAETLAKDALRWLAANVDAPVLAGIFGVITGTNIQQMLIEEGSIFVGDMLRACINALDGDRVKAEVAAAYSAADAAIFAAEVAKFGVGP